MKRVKMQRSTVPRAAVNFSDRWFQLMFVGKRLGLSVRSIALKGEQKGFQHCEFAFEFEFHSFLIPLCRHFGIVETHTENGWNFSAMIQWNLIIFELLRSTKVVRGGEFKQYAIPSFIYTNYIIDSWLQAFHNNRLSTYFAPQYVWSIITLNNN